MGELRRFLQKSTPAGKLGLFGDDDKSKRRRRRAEAAVGAEREQSLARARAADESTQATLRREREARRLRKSLTNPATNLIIDPITGREALG